MLGLLLWLVWLLLFGASGSSTSGTATATAAASARAPLHAAFTVDGRAVAATGSIRLRQGELLRFQRGVAGLRLQRLECHDDTHRLALAGRSWRVPDLPTGLYELAGRGSTFGFSYLVTVHSHAAPCPGP